MKQYFKAIDFLADEDRIPRPGTSFVPGEKILPLEIEFQGIPYSLIVRFQVVVEMWYEPFPPHGPAKTNDLASYNIQIMYASTPEEEITCIEDLEQLEQYLKTQIVLT